MLNLNGKSVKIYFDCMRHMQNKQTRQQIPIRSWMGIKWDVTKKKINTCNISIGIFNDSLSIKCVRFSIECIEFAFDDVKWIRYQIFNNIKYLHANSWGLTLMKMKFHLKCCILFRMMSKSVHQIDWTKWRKKSERKNSFN